MQEKIKNPLFYEENRIAAHSDHKYYVNEAECAQKMQSLKRSLDGVWAVDVLLKITLLTLKGVGLILVVCRYAAVGSCFYHGSSPLKYFLSCNLVRLHTTHRIGL